MAERRNIQGLVAWSYQQFGYLHSAHLMVAVGQAQAGRGFVGALLPHVPHAAQDMAAAAGWVANVSLSWAGLRALDLADGALPRLASEFEAGPDPVVTGDTGLDAPEHWWEGQFGSGKVHLVVHLAGRSEALVDEAIAAVRRAMPDGVTELAPTRDGRPLRAASLAPDPRELHFGYLDGFSQPDVDWEGRQDRPGALPPGSLLLGQDNGAAAGLARDGSYLVLRWIRQDVAAFEQFLTANAPKVAHLMAHVPGTDPREWLAARMMGRWRDGTPVALSPDEPAPHLAAAPFDYAADPHGHRCPFAAHVRIANHRDDPLSRPNEVMFGPGQPRVLRRGMSYGPKLQGHVCDGVDRGIVGLFFCASINQQFYPLLRWMRKTNFRDVFEQTSTRQQDPIVGNRAEPLVDKSFVIPSPNGSVVLPDLPAFLRTKGTLFLLTPGMDALRRMSGQTGV